jgi:YVTN family beta-propeller protein
MIDAKSVLRLMCLSGCVSLALCVQAGGQTIVGNISLGKNPTAATVDLALNKIYIVNSGSNNVTVVSEFTDASSSIAVGNAPSALAVNPVTSRLYVTNTADATVTVIDEASNSVLSTLKVGKSPVAVAVNTATGKVYVANRDDNTVTIIDGATNATSSVAVGSAPVAIAVNPADNTVYVANQNSNNVTILSGTDGSATAFPVGNSPTAVAVEPTTDVVYVVNKGDNTITAVNRASDAMSIFSVGTSPASIAINPVTNKIYVPSSEDATVTVIDGLTATATTVNVGVSPLAIALDSITNKIYVANNQATGGASLVSVIDGATNSVSEVAGSGAASTIALDPKSGRVYVPDIGTSSAMVIEEATNSSTAVNVGTYPRAIAFDPVTGYMFICNDGSGSVSILDTASNTVTTLPTVNSPIFNSPLAVAVNPVTNRAYVTNAFSGTVSVVDVAAKAVTQTIPIGYSEQDTVTVDPVTNRVYVAVSSQNELAIIDGATDSISTLQVGEYPQAVAVNPVTNRIYVLNASSNSVSVIDGATIKITATIAVPSSATLALNPNTNKIYAGGEAGTLTVIDGATNDTLSIQVPTGPNHGSSIAVNRQTNRIYMAGANGGSGSPTSVIVVDGASEKVITSVNTTASAGTIVVNPLTDQIYVDTTSSTNEIQPGLMIIDGATNTSKTLLLPVAPASLAVDSESGKIYVTASGNNSIEVFTPNQIEPIPLTTAISGVPDNQTVSTTNVFQTRNPSPIFTAQVTSSYASPSSADLTVSPPASAVYYEVDGGANPWTRATLNSSNGANPAAFSLCLSNIPVGLHTLYAFPSYGDESAESGPGNGRGSASQIGNITVVTFLIEPGGTAGSTPSLTCASTQPPSGPSIATTTTLSASVSPQTFRGSVTFTASVNPSSGAGSPTGTVTFFDGTSQLGSAPLGSNLTAAYSASSLTIGSHSITAAYGGDSTFISSTSSPLIETIVQPAPIATSTALTSSANPQTVDAAVTFTATVNPSTPGSTSPTGTISFFDGTTLLGTATLGATLTASFTSFSLSIGSHSITAAYSGDTNFSSSTSQALIESIVAAPASGDYTLSANPASLTITSGGTGTVTLTISPLNGFQGTVSLACADLPSNVVCSFQSPTVNVVSASAQQTVLTLSASPNSQAQAKRDSGQGTKLLTWPAIFLPVLGVGAALRPRRRWRRGRTTGRWVMLVALLTSVLVLGGCGVTFNGYPNTYKIIVSASANGGVLLHQTTVSVTVQQ